MTDPFSTRDSLRSMRGGFGNSGSPFPGQRLRRSFYGFGVAVVVILAILAIGVGATLCSAYAKEKTATVVVNDKERVCDGGQGGECRYLLFTDQGTYEITDSILVGRFTSSDFYGRIRECHRYELTYIGWRFGIMSSYPNVKSAEDLGKVEGCEVS